MGSGRGCSPSPGKTSQTQLQVYNETKINLFAQHQELLPQRTVTDVLHH